MLSNLIFKSVPHLFVLFFLFFEFSPNYFFEKQLIKPYMFFIVIYCWLNNDYRKFSPFSIFIYCTLYDLLKGEVVGITCLYLLMIQYSIRKKYNELISNDFKEDWIKFILSFTAYLSISSLSNVIFFDYQIDLKTMAISYIFSIALFPLFFSMIEKLSFKFRSFNE